MSNGLLQNTGLLYGPAIAGSWQRQIMKKGIRLDHCFKGVQRCANQAKGYWATWIKGSPLQSPVTIRTVPHGKEPDLSWYNNRCEPVYCLTLLLQGLYLPGQLSGYSIFWIARCICGLNGPPRQMPSSNTDYRFCGCRCLYFCHRTVAEMIHSGNRTQNYRLWGNVQYHRLPT